jgi:hypothetical protein
MALDDTLQSPVEGSGGLSPADLVAFGRFGIPPELLLAAQVRRVTSSEARDLIGIRYHSPNLAGLVFPYVDPNTGGR